MHIGYPCILTSNITFLGLSLSLSLSLFETLRLSKTVASAEDFFGVVKALVMSKS